MDSISANPEAPMEEKRKMMDMLKRFEESQVDGEDFGVDSEDEDELARALRDVDIDDLDTNALFHLLPQEHRDRFLAAIKDPDSLMAKDLLASAVEGDTAGLGPTVLPWWERTKLEDEDELEMKYADPPKAFTSNIPTPEGTGLRLAYNAISICLAYIHTMLSLRLPSLSPEHLIAQSVHVAELKDDIGRLVPFLQDVKSTVRHGTLREAWSSPWEAIGEDLEPPPDTSLLIRLLDTLSSLLHPPLITTEFPKAFLVLSDLHYLYSTPKAGAAAPRKLAFYLSAIQQLHRQDWLRLEAEVKQELMRLQQEAEKEVDEEEDRPKLKI
ncbi:hypothetical protein P7C73_g4402, partial [Tremellales sp. Uapishka_1]